MNQTQRALTELDVLRDLARRLEAEGYEVELDAHPAELGSRFGPRRVDLLARRGDEVVVYEVKSRGQLDTAAVRQLRAELGALGWPLEVVFVQPDQEAPTREAVLQRLEGARRLDDEVAALLVAWAALEGSLHLLAQRAGRSFDSVPSFLRSAYSIDLISEGQFSYISEALNMRARAAHGLTVEIPAGMIDRLLALAEWYVSGSFTPVEEMVDWFQSEYEDPAEGVPYSSREGGYQYIAGGPYSADEALADQYPDAPEFVVEEAVGIIEEAGLVEWVRRGDY